MGSFAPAGLRLNNLGTHGLRRGLHSFAASRLEPFDEMRRSLSLIFEIMGSFALAGLRLNNLGTHGLRRGLHSFAASRLGHSTKCAGVSL
jgi:hypothetical protein